MKGIVHFLYKYPVFRADCINNITFWFAGINAKWDEYLGRFKRTIGISHFSCDE